MFSFLIPKTKIQAYDIAQIPIEKVEIFGITQINPNCHSTCDKEIFLTLVNLANTSRHYDEKEGFVVSEYFTVKKCPKCRKISLLPVYMKLNLSRDYLKNEEDFVMSATHYSKRTFSSKIHAFCSSCSSCFDILIEKNDCWVKEARKIKEYNLVMPSWSEYRVDDSEY